MNEKERKGIIRIDKVKSIFFDLKKNLKTQGSWVAQ